MRVSVDQDRCVGAGQCVRWAPEHFEQDEETGIIRPFEGELTIKMGTGVEGAVRACPSGALRLRT
ncbi:ferredoxin [Kineosporia mesophila]|uniref:Ferredoxin n=1 Tax=Kineosporia mesophila TaxID=566012 RepID=A0ABP6Z9N1_9ACTN|nr:ferredoxin [Kineosporia mesophila]MCD5351921.1 ferredoxin [Kineosporia mesophila]